MIGRALGRLGLAARIGAAILAAVIAIQALVTLVFLLHPPSLRPLYSARWLSGEVAKILKNRETAEAAPVGAPAQTQNPEALSVRIERAQPPDFVRADPEWPMNRVLATVHAHLGEAAPPLAASGMGPPNEPVQVVPTDAFATLPSGPLRSEEDLLVPPNFLIAADLHDGRWLIIEPSERAREGGAAVACLHLRRDAC